MGVKYENIILKSQNEFFRQKYRENHVKKKLTKKSIFSLKR